MVGELVERDPPDVVAVRAESQEERGKQKEQGGVSLVYPARR